MIFDVCFLMENCGRLKINLCPFSHLQKFFSNVFVVLCFYGDDLIEM